MPTMNINANSVNRLWQTGHERLNSMSSLSTKRIVFTLITLIILAQFINAFVNKPNPVSVLYWDTSAYATALTQHNLPSALSKDTIYGNHKFADSMWASSFIYLAMLDFLHTLSGGDIVLAYNLIAALL